MQYGLGIDAGGTYTDSVIIDFTSQEVLAKNKALTTKYDLGLGIAASLAGLPRGLLPNIEMVALSTTLATNAIVEGMGDLVACLLLGFDEYDLAKIHHKPSRVVQGSTDIVGEIVAELDEEGLKQAVLEMEAREKPVAYVVSGMAAVKNPQMELQAQKIVAELTGKVVVCGHEVSMQLDTIKRTNTAILNARLFPIIAELMDQVLRILRSMKVTSPLMVVRADGTLMSEAAARKYPVETILSGPAASICGASFLTGVQNGLVVDIGGTTSDIALIKDGQPAVSLAGATIANWSTHVRAVDIDTLGLAGDSAVHLSRDGRLLLGPRRAEPLAVLAADYPQVREELQRLWTLHGNSSTLAQPVEFYRRIDNKDSHVLAETERRLLDALKEGPLSRLQLASELNLTDPSLVPVSRLESLFIIQRSTLTPTDILHVRGVFTRWDTEASKKGLDLFAYRAQQESEAFADRVLEAFTEELLAHLVKRLLRPSDTVSRSKPGQIIQAIHERDPLLNLLVSGSSKGGFSLKPQYEHSLIGIGAPSYALTPPVAKRLGTKLLVPEHAEVANAVGAITGIQAISVEVVISPIGEAFAVHSPLQRREFLERDEAEAWARLHVVELLEERIKEEGLTGFLYHREFENKETIGQSNSGDIFLELVFRAVGIYKPTLVHDYR